MARSNPKASLANIDKYEILRNVIFLSIVAIFQKFMAFFRWVKTQIFHTAKLQEKANHSNKLVLNKYKKFHEGSIFIILLWNPKNDYSFNLFVNRISTQNRKNYSLFYIYNWYFEYCGGF